MSIRLAIHDRPGGFSSRWLQCCRERGIDNELVDCYDSDIISQLREFDGLMWHIDHQRPRDLLMARHVTIAAELMGLVVFPSFKTSWHFDDKLAQKYLLESYDVPFAPSCAFFDKEKALAYAQQSQYPIVAKLRGGAGSHNVKLLKDYSDVESYCRIAFGKGFESVPGYFGDAKRKIHSIKSMGQFWNKLKRMPQVMRLIASNKKTTAREKGYVLFQKFFADNQFDIRITVVGDRAWGFTRDVRAGDWRASGSGVVRYDLDRIGEDAVKISFDATEKMGTQSLALDFVRDPEGQPYIVEVSYGYVSSCVRDAPGYWSRDMTFTEAHLWPEYAHVEDVVRVIHSRAGKS